MKMNRGPSVSGPSSSLGIMRFFDSEMEGPKMTPEFVMIVTVAFVAIEIAMHMMS